jgi:hypothetical protein
MTTDGYNLNYQVQVHYRVKSSYNETVNFELLNNDGKKEFTQGHTLQLGQTDEFMNRMNGMYIIRSQNNQCKICKRTKSRV